MKANALLVFLLVFIAFVQVVAGVYFEWTGDVDSDYANPANWKIGGVPATYLPGQSTDGIDTERVGAVPFLGQNPVYNYDNQSHWPTGAHVRIGGAQAASFTMEGGYNQRSGQVLYIGWNTPGQWYHRGGTFLNRNEQVQVGRAAKGYLEVSGGSFLTTHLHVGVLAGSGGSEVLIKDTGDLVLAPNDQGLLTLGSTGSSSLTVQGGRFFNNRTGATASIIKNNSVLKLEGGEIDLRGNLTVSDTSRVRISGGELWLRNNTLVLQGSSSVHITGGKLFNTGTAAFHLSGTSCITLQDGFTQTAMLSFADDSCIHFTGGTLELTGMDEQHIIDLINSGRLMTTLAAGQVEYMSMGAGVFQMYANAPIIVFNPYPENSESNVPVDAVLTWQQSDLGGGQGLTYDVYVGSSPDAMVWVKSTTDNPADFYFAPPDRFSFDTPYYWGVDTVQHNGQTPTIHTGSLWQFTTAPIEADAIITAQPNDVLLFAGQTAMIEITALNPLTWDDSGLRYQWYKIGSPDTAVGDNAPVLILENIMLEDIGWYYCVVSMTEPPDGYVSSPAVSHPARLLIKRLLGHWKLDDNLDDSSGNDHHGVPVGVLSFAAFPAEPSLAVSEKSLYCVLGEPNYVEIPVQALNEVSSQTTISFWSYSTAEPDPYDPHTDTPDRSLVDFRVPHWTQGIELRMGDPDAPDRIYEPASTDWMGGRWTHWVVIKDSHTGLMQIYHNGRLWQQATDAFGLIRGAARFFIGGSPREGAFGGHIDDVRLYNYTLTTEDIAAIHPRPMLPEPADGQADVVYDTVLRWTPGDGSSSFSVYYSDRLDLDAEYRLIDPIVISGLTAPETALLQNLKPNTVYYWYVQESDGGGHLVWTGDVWSFTVRPLAADIIGNDAVLHEDLLALALRWMEDYRVPGIDLLLDAGVYDPDFYAPDHADSFAYYWGTHWTLTGGQPGGTEGGSAWYGTAYCQAIDDPEHAIAWHFDTATSLGKTDADMFYWHRGRTPIPLSQFDELRFEIKAAPGSDIQQPYYRIEGTGGTLHGTLEELDVLGDGQWHDVGVPLDTDAGFLVRFRMGIQAAAFAPKAGTWYFRNVRVVNHDPKNLRCLPMYYIPEDLNEDCRVDLEDLAIMATEWLMDARND